MEAKTLCQILWERKWSKHKQDVLKQPTMEVEIKRISYLLAFWWPNSCWKRLRSLAAVFLYQQGCILEFSGYCWNTHISEPWSINTVQCYKPERSLMTLWKYAWQWPVAGIWLKWPLNRLPASVHSQSKLRCFMDGLHSANLTSHSHWMQTNIK